MPVLFPPFASSTVLDPDAVNEYFYDHTSSTSLSVVNGHLDETHQDASWDISSDHVRSGSMWGARMSGQTGVLDYNSLLFEGTNDSGDIIEKVDPIPGASTSFYVPRTITGCAICTWQIVMAGNSHPMRGETSREDSDEGEDKEQQVLFFLDDTEYKSQRRFAVTGAKKTSSLHYRTTHRDRIWSGHQLLTSLQKGWHTAWLGCYVKNTQLLRIRIRNMKVIWFV
jgi:hypothetical protein